MYVRPDSLRGTATAALLASTIVALAAIATPVRARDADLSAIRAEVTRRHDETVKRLQEWIAEAEAMPVALEVFRYPGVGHYFTDRTLADYDAAAAELLLGRALAFLGRA